MPSLETMQVWITIAALAFATVSFLLFLFMMLGWIKPEDTNKAAQDQAVNSMESMAVAPTPAEVAELVKALATFSESLMKAGPRLWTLIGSILFLLIAAIAAGSLQGAPKRDETRPDVHATDAAVTATDAAPRKTGAPVNENLSVHP